MLIAAGTGLVSAATGLSLLPRTVSESHAAKVGATTHNTSTADGLRLEATPACADGRDAPTVSQTEGPFYTPRTPLRASLVEPGMTGLSVVLVGRVITTDCRPIPDAVLDFWQADDHGEYDNVGYRLRGHQRTDRDGQFHLETIKPGAYGNFLFRRTPHLHVKVQGQATPLLTTQLYFPGESLNVRDGIFDPRLIMDIQRDGERLKARFDFVLQSR